MCSLMAFPRRREANIQITRRHSPYPERAINGCAICVEKLEPGAGPIGCHAFPPKKIRPTSARLQEQDFV
jgi:hypothetical protein